jgi:addiction module HigA family antidote
MNMMFNAQHPGEMLREYIGETPVTEAAQALGVTQANLSRILNGHTGISADMAIRLSEALETSPEFWLNLQMQHDLWNASQCQRPIIKKLVQDFAQESAVWRFICL